MNCDDILPLLQSSPKGTTYQELCGALREIEPAELFHGLFPLSIQSLHRDPAIPSYAAGNLLFDLNPTCPVGCGRVISAITFSEWDVSLEEVIFYAYRQFGFETVNAMIQGIGSGPLSARQRTLLDTIQYWVNCAHGVGIETILQRRAENH